MPFSFDEGALREVAQSAVDKIARDLTRKLGVLTRSCAGQPVAAIRPRVKRLFTADGGSISDHELTEYAEAISAGTLITVKAAKVRM